MQKYIDFVPNYCALEEPVVANFSVSTEKVYKDRAGNNIVEVMWHHVCIWEGKGRNLRGLSRGVLVHLTEELRHQKYLDTAGSEKIFTEILADTLRIINENDSREDFKDD